MDGYYFVEFTFKNYVLINETASRLANETSNMTNDGSLQQAEIIGNMIAIGIVGLRQYNAK